MVSQHVLGLSWGLHPWDVLGTALSREPWTQYLWSILKWSHKGQSGTSSTDQQQVLMWYLNPISVRWRWLWGPLSTTTFFPLNQCARLWEDIYFSWSCDCARDCKILSSYEKGSRGVILVLSGPELHPTYEFLSKAESMIIHASLITHYLRVETWSFLGLLQFQHKISQFKIIILRVFLHSYILYACASEDHFYSYCRSWVSPWFKGQFKRRAFFVDSLSILSSAIMLAFINSHNKSALESVILFSVSWKSKNTCMYWIITRACFNPEMPDQ